MYFGEKVLSVDCLLFALSVHNEQIYEMHQINS